MSEASSIEALTDWQIQLMCTIPLFEGVDKDVMRWIVRRVEWEHGIGHDPRGLTESGVIRVKDCSPAEPTPPA